MALQHRVGALMHDARQLLQRSGWDLHRYRAYPPDLTPDEIALWELVAPYTQLDLAKILAFSDAAAYVVRSGVPGAILECGVGPGGSTMAVARTLERLGADRDLYLLDTFAGPPQPTDRDVEVIGSGRVAQMRSGYADPRHPLHVPPSVEQVSRHMSLAGYAEEHVHYVVGPVEETVPEQAPDEIAVLRLDTDWYEATRHELEHLYPRLVPGGVLIVDDYSNWAHQRQAVDEYFASRPMPFLVRIGYGCRVAVKQA